MENEKNSNEEVNEEVVKEEVDKEIEVEIVEEKSELEVAKEKLQEANDKHLRLKAEFQNYKKRVEKEKSALIKYSHGEVVKDLLPVIDNFDRAINSSNENKGNDVESLLEGIEMIKKSLDTFLENAKVEEVKSVGEKFDTKYHHAVMKEESEEFEHNIVIEELQKGFILEGKVIRHAMVKVASNK